MAPLTQFDRGRPLVKLGQQSGFNLLEVLSNPLLVFFGQHMPIIGQGLNLIAIISQEGWGRNLTGR